MFRFCRMEKGLPEPESGEQVPGYHHPKVCPHVELRHLMCFVLQLRFTHVDFHCVFGGLSCARLLLRL
jgi:hypothetical protein